MDTTINAIPDYQSLMLPLLELLSDGKEYSSSQAIENLAYRFNLTEDQKGELLPSGTQTIIGNRTGWAKFYLERAGLLETVKRGVYKITEEGLNLLDSNPTEINVGLLKTQPKFKKWFAEFGANKKSKTLDESEEVSEIENIKTPDEQISEAYSRIHEKLAYEVLEKVKTVTPAKFEEIVVDLLKAMGYGGPDRNGRTLGKSGDGGVDGVIKEDKLGLEMIYVQAKKWEAAVTISSVRDFAGALLSKKARKGVFITTSTFPKSATQFVNSIDPKIILIDGKQLAKYMIEFQVGVSTKQTLIIKRMDTDYFDEV